MKIVFTSLFGTCVALSLQAQVVSIQPRTAAPVSSVPATATGEVHRRTAVSVPLLGFLAGPGNTELHQIVGTPSSAHIGDSVAPPAAAAKIYLAPRQMYAIVERKDVETLGVWETWHPQKAGDEVVLPIAGQGLLPHPEIVGFSPGGSAAVLYSSLMGKIQVLTGLPRRGVIAYELASTPVGALSKVRVSDDGAVVVGEGADGELNLSVSAGPWRTIAGIAARAWLLLPNSHDIAISDGARNGIFVARKVDDPSTVPALAASGLQPDQLAVCKDGDTLVAFDSSKSQVWTVSLISGKVTPDQPSQVPNTLLTLRDGHTFLLSASPAVSLLEVAAPSSVGSTR